MIPEAFVLSAYYRLRLKYTAFSSFASSLGAKAETEYGFISDKRIIYISRTVRRVCSHTPWESACFVRALTARRMLVKRGIPCTLYLGTCMEDGKMTAHAWLRAGSIYVSGGNGTGYAVTAFYGTK